MKINILKEKLEKLGIQPQKDLGQNFLIDERVSDLILDKVKNNSSDIIYEIGPGLGALTDKIKIIDCRLVLVEFDKKVVSYWESLGHEVIHKDALKMNWEEIEGKRAILVSNLPYQISSSLVIECSVKSNFRYMILMFQKEVAQKLMSKPKSKNYGMLSVIAQTCWEIKMVTKVSRSSFYPSPKIESSVLEFFEIKQKEIQLSKFLSFLKLCFKNRRKLLLKKLLSYINSREELEKIFALVKIKSNARAEDLTPNDFLKLYKVIKSEC